ncbi:hypothetical protein I4U23_011812 [Adineta vaga]|nr:hypothetical protein I4U23_011812 [Adineta vaga]
MFAVEIIKTSSILRDTTEHIADRCYYCSICPQPFSPDGEHVQTTTSATGWCLSKSVSNDTDNDYELGVAHDGLCHEEGCSWIVEDTKTWWICCCNEHLCNKGVPHPPTTTTPSTSPAPIMKLVITLFTIALIISTSFAL